MGNFWDTNAGQQYLNEMARQKKSASMDESRLNKAKEMAMSKKERKHLENIKKKRRERIEKRRADQKKKESEQKGYWR